RHQGRTTPAAGQADGPDRSGDLRGRPALRRPGLPAHHRRQVRQPGGAWWPLRLRRPPAGAREPHHGAAAPGAARARGAVGLQALHRSRRPAAGRQRADRLTDTPPDRPTVVSDRLGRVGREVPTHPPQPVYRASSGWRARKAGSVSVRNARNSSSPVTSSASPWYPASVTTLPAGTPSIVRSPGRTPRSANAKSIGPRPRPSNTSESPADRTTRSSRTGSVRTSRLNAFETIASSRRCWLR